MAFNVAPSAYARFMGRFSEPLALKFVDLLDVRPDDRALDVGCGTGVLTAVLVDHLGEAAVHAVDPSPPFVEGMHARFPAVDCRLASAESLPFDDASFDVTAAQLVVHFMSDPVAGVREMLRVTRAGGTVGANVWDHAGDTSPLATFRQAVRDLDPTAPDESKLPGARSGHLEQIFREAGATDVRASVLTVEVAFATFDEWWEPFTFGVGPAGDYVKTLDTDALAALRQRCSELLPARDFSIEASAWAVVARAPA
jgi:ubiquinone/menaquinone biosynthesis C-methylase UbiE